MEIKYYSITEERGQLIGRPLDTFHAPVIPDGIYSSEVLYEWQNIGFKVLSHRIDVPLQHAACCICDKCLDNI